MSGVVEATASCRSAAADLVVEQVELPNEGRKCTGSFGSLFFFSFSFSFGFSFSFVTRVAQEAEAEAEAEAEGTPLLQFKLQSECHTCQIKRGRITRVRAFVAKRKRFGCSHVGINYKNRNPMHAPLCLMV